MVISRPEKQFPLFRFPKSLVDMVYHMHRRRPVVEGQAQSGRAVAISGSKFNERTPRPAMSMARGGGWHVRARRCIRGSKAEHTHVSPADPYVNLRIDQRIVSNVHRV